MSDPITIAALVASIGGISSLLKPLLKALFSSIKLKSEKEGQNIEISVIDSDGSKKSIKFDSSKSKTLSEEQIKRIIDTLKEANDAETNAS